MNNGAWAIITSIAIFFIVHVFYFGKIFGRFETLLKTPTDAFREFKDQNYITRNEYNERHNDLVTMVTKLIKTNDLSGNIERTRRRE